MRSDWHMSTINLPTRLMSVMLLSAAFAGYCCSGGDQGADANSNDPNANATGTCCTPAAPQTKVLWEGTLTNGRTPVLQVGSYREIMVASSGCSIVQDIAPNVWVYGKPTGGRADYNWGELPLAARIPVYTPEVYLVPNNCGASSYVVLGIN